MGRNLNRILLGPDLPRLTAAGHGKQPRVVEPLPSASLAESLARFQGCFRPAIAAVRTRRVISPEIGGPRLAPRKVMEPPAGGVL